MGGSAIGTAAAAQSSTRHLYWTVPESTLHEYETVPGSLWRANLTSKHITQLASGSESPDGIAIEGTHVYWLDDGGTLWRSNLDGTGPVSELVTSGTSCVANAIAVDSQHIYWSCYVGTPSPGSPATPATIGRADLDGRNSDPSFITVGSGNIAGLAVDGGHIYWTDQVASDSRGTIGRANLGGTRLRPRLVTGIHLPFGLAVNQQHIYWVDSNRGTISRANVDGSHVIRRFIRAPAAEVVKIDRSHVYWTGLEDDAIERASIDGSHVNHSFIRLRGSTYFDTGPAGLAVGP